MRQLVEAGREDWLRTWDAVAYMLLLLLCLVPFAASTCVLLWELYRGSGNKWILTCLRIMVDENDRDGGGLGGVLYVQHGLVLVAVVVGIWY